MRTCNFFSIVCSHKMWNYIYTISCVGEKRRISIELSSNISVRRCELKANKPVRGRSEQYQWLEWNESYWYYPQYPILFISMYSLIFSVCWVGFTGCIGCIPRAYLSLLLGFLFSHFLAESKLLNISCRAWHSCYFYEFGALKVYRGDQEFHFVPSFISCTSFLWTLVQSFFRSLYNKYKFPFGPRIFS